MGKYDEGYFADLEKADLIEYPRNKRILDEIERFQKSQGKLLDIGVGTGLFLKIAQKNKWQVSGVDVSSYAIKRLKKLDELKNVVLKVGELKNNTFKPNSFDTVNIRHALEHVKEPKELLEIVYKILKPGGIVAIATPNSFGLQAKVFGKLWPHWDPPYHLHFFSKHSLKNLVENNGFEVLKLKTEELSNYDLFRITLSKIGLKCSYNNPTKLSLIINDFLGKIGLGDGLLLIAQKPL